MNYPNRFATSNILMGRSELKSKEQMNKQLDLKLETSNGLKSQLSTANDE